jgi:hypothetical protein
MFKGDVRLLTEVLAEPAQELGEDRPRVPARPHDGGVRHRSEGVADGLRHLRRLHDVVQGDGEIGSRVAVGDRKDIDRVQVVLQPDHFARARVEGVGELMSVELLHRFSRKEQNILSRPRVCDSFLAALSLL